MAADDLDGLRQARNFDEFEPAWSRFLVSANAADMIIQSNAKGGREQPWYGRKIHARRKDPLLAYMHTARNVDEHGIEPVARDEPGFLAIGVAGDSIHIENAVFRADGSFTATVRPVDGKLPTIVNQPAYPKLVAVTDDRFGDTFAPPSEHLGKPLTDASPIGVATVWLAYLEGLVGEAEQFVDS